MTREVKKAAYEREVFGIFLTLADVDIRLDTIASGNATKNEPDILCEYVGGEPVGFELGRLVDPKLAQVVNRWEPRNSEFTWTGDSSRAIAKRKIKQTYSVTFPVELIFYKENPNLTLDDQIVHEIRSMCDLKHQYRRVWFMSEKVELLYERS